MSMLLDSQDLRLVDCTAQYISVVAAHVDGSCLPIVSRCLHIIARCAPTPANPLLLHLHLRCRCRLTACLALHCTHGFILVYMSIDV